uniref:Integrase catalytic domain-containing protein n=1 Tax=Lactuca sativa TaxID=4236 RepID=A0A9R1UTJ5_LACSA|nr:hypothetical protein LSAT_V11C800390800 [Lactuca sativa]
MPNDIWLRDVLLVPKLSKNLLSISRLTTDNNLDVLFSQPYFYIQDRTTRKVLAQGICDRDLYVLSTAPHACFASTQSSSSASFELWHSRLGHAFTWFYPLKTKSDFPTILDVFLKFVQTQFSCKIKVFQSDGGTEFLNHNVQRILTDNGTFHRVSCLYTPQQNGRVEHKHRHIVETGLAMMFNGHIPPSYWVHAFSSAVYIINRLPTPLFLFTGASSQTPETLLMLSRLYDEDYGYATPTPPVTTSPASPAPSHACGFYEDDTPVDVSADPPTTPLAPPINTDQVRETNPGSTPTLDATTQLLEVPPVTPAVQPPTGGHHMQTRAKSGIFKPKHHAHLAQSAISSALYVDTAPKGFKTSAKHPTWMSAMHKEMDALLHNNTWTLVLLPRNHNVVVLGVGCEEPRKV